MLEQGERRQEWKRIVGIERRGAPIQTLEGHALPDPTRLLDEEFEPEEKKSLPWYPEDLSGLM